MIWGGIVYGKKTKLTFCPRIRQRAPISCEDAVLREDNGPIYTAGAVANWRDKHSIQKLQCLDQVANNPVLFTAASQQKFIEMSFLIEFWGPIIELFFDPNQYFIQWGDTTSPYLSLSNLYFNLDFRVIIKDINADELDVATGEVVREASIASSKVNYDFLKSALTTKAHLNATLKRMPYMTLTRIKYVVVPMVQIMGLSCTLYGLMIKNIEAMITEYSRRPSHSMPNIRKGKKKNNNAKMIVIDEYISPVIPSAQDDELTSEENNSEGESDEEK
ncbi:hypothetical protein G6F56_003706 [Rhizopus delemar]|nr:hypothetical protein G6F56_003706 [Rhizopus delemar]